MKIVDGDHAHLDAGEWIVLAPKRELTHDEYAQLCDEIKEAGWYERVLLLPLPVDMMVARKDDEFLTVKVEG